MLKLSVVIITFNEERNIKRCLDSVVEFADEILVLDSFSVDQTKNIIQQYKFPIQLFEKQFSGYGDSKNFLEQKASCDFIFSIDADEEVDENSIELKLNGLFRNLHEGAQPEKEILREKMREALIFLKMKHLEHPRCKDALIEQNDKLDSMVEEYRKGYIDCSMSGNEDI